MGLDISLKTGLQLASDQANRARPPHCLEANTWHNKCQWETGTAQILTVCNEQRGLILKLSVSPISS